MRLGDLGGGDPKRVEGSRLVGSNLGERAWERGGQAGRDGWASSGGGRPNPELNVSRSLSLVSICSGGGVIFGTPSAHG